jgi:hypothetical protein
MKTEQGETPMYLGRVTGVMWNRQVMVIVDDLAGRNLEVGPLPTLVPFVSYQYSIGSTYIPTHGYHSHSGYIDDILMDEYTVGDLVLVAQIGLIKEDLIVLGKVYSEPSGGCG